MNIFNHIFSILKNDWLKWIILSLLFYFLQPKLVELIDSIFLNLSVLGIDADNHLKISNLAVLLIITLVFFLFKSPIQKDKF